MHLKCIFFRIYFIFNRQPKRIGFDFSEFKINISRFFCFSIKVEARNQAQGNLCKYHFEVFMKKQSAEFKNNIKNQFHFAQNQKNHLPIGSHCY